MDIETELERLASSLFDAKRREDAAKTERVTLEEQIAAQIETAANGSKTVPIGNGLKITVKRAMGYKVDIDGLRESTLSEIPITFSEPVPAMPMFDQKRYEALVEADSNAAALMAKYVTAVPKKPSVTIKFA